MLKILFIGDISGRPGRETVSEVLPKVRDQYSPDLVIANVENAAGGIGITSAVIKELQGYGVDIFTGGDHTFRFKEFIEEIQDNSLPIVIPSNYEARSLPGKRFEVIDLGSKGTVGVINILGQELMPGVQRVTSPFWFIDDFFSGALPYSPQQLNKYADIWVCDFHAETATEKLSFAWYARNRLATVVGTHTHVATADNRLLGGTAYVSDIGQVGPYEASLWVDFDITVHNYKYPNRKQFKISESYPRIFNSVLVSYENYSPVSIERIDVALER